MTGHVGWRIIFEAHAWRIRSSNSRERYVLHAVHTGDDIFDHNRSQYVERDISIAVTWSKMAVD